MLTKRFVIIIFIFLPILFCAQENRFKSYFNYIDSSKNHLINLDELQKFKAKNKLNFNEQVAFYDRAILASVELQKYYLSLKYSFQGLKIAQYTGIDSLICLYTMKIGNSYYYIHDINNALTYYFKSLQIARKNKLWRQETKILNNIGAMYLDLQNLEKAEKYLKKAIEIFKSKDLLYSEGLLTYRLLATLNQQKGNYQESMKIFKEVIKYAELSDNIDLLTFSMVYYSRLLIDLKQYKEALNYTSKALEIQRKVADNNALSVILINHALTLKENKLFEQAIEVFREVIVLNKKIYKENIEHDIADIEVKYKTQEIIRERELAETKILNERNQKNMYVLFFIGILLIIVSLFLFVFYRQKLKRIKIEQDLQKKHLIALIEAQEQEKVRIARDLHDGICQKFIVTKMKLNTLKEEYTNLSKISQDNFDAALNLVDEATFETRGLAHEIMPPAFLTEGLIEVVNQLCYQTFYPQINYTFESFGEKVRLSSIIEINIYRIVQELFANILKHAKASNVSVQFFAKNNKITLIVEDDGVGIKEEQLGMGFKNIELRCKMLNGKFTIQNSPNGGTLATFVLHYN
jgi:two-component system, NarL family, sensor kinase